MQGLEDQPVRRSDQGLVSNSAAQDRVVKELDHAKGDRERDYDEQPEGPAWRYWRLSRQSSFGPLTVLHDYFRLYVDLRCVLDMLLIVTVHQCDCTLERLHEWQPASQLV